MKAGDKSHDPLARTNEIIRKLADDPRPVRSIEMRLAIALLLGLAGSLALWAFAYGPRADIASVLGEPGFLLRPALAIVLFAGALAGCLALARPTGRLRSARMALAVVPITLAALVVAELSRLPASSWREAWLTGDPLGCVIAILAIATPVMIALMIALRAGAPRSPARTGGLAGLAAAGVAGGLFGLYCPMDSSLFVATWYGLAAMLLAGLGALAGRRWLAW